jgi:hypothetical protein
VLFLVAQVILSPCAFLGWQAVSTATPVWIAVVAMMYPLCLRFARLKERRQDWWLSYV